MPLAYICDDCHASVPVAKTHCWNEEDTDTSGNKTYASRRTAHLCEQCATKRVKAIDQRRRGKGAAA